MENGQFSGQLKFNFNNSNNETIDVTEDFNEAYIQVELNGASNIDKNTVKVKINDKTYKYKKDKSYGPYPKHKKLRFLQRDKLKRKHLSHLQQL